MISVVLLRGVNVGGNRTILMADLRTWLGAAGFTGVQTYIQSGNVVVEHSARIDVVAQVRAVIKENSGLDVPIVVRTAGELHGVVASNPYATVEPTKLHVSFLPSAPDDATLAASAQTHWRPEEFTLEGNNVYLHLPNGMGRSVMVPRLALIRDATTRNWNTVLALATLAAR